MLSGSLFVFSHIHTVPAPPPPVVQILMWRRRLMEERRWGALGGGGGPSWGESLPGSWRAGEPPRLSPLILSPPPPLAQASALGPWLPTHSAPPLPP